MNANLLAMIGASAVALSIGGCAATATNEDAVESADAISDPSAEKPALRLAVARKVDPTGRRSVSLSGTMARAGGVRLVTTGCVVRSEQNGQSASCAPGASIRVAGSSGSLSEPLVLGSGVLTSDDLPQGIFGFICDHLPPDSIEISIYFISVTWNNPCGNTAPPPPSGPPMSNGGNRG